MQQADMDILLREGEGSMHRDWFAEGANVFVEIYSDRIEISSPGGLPKGMLPSDLGRKSVRRNLLIADMLHRIGLIEKAGTGIKRMRDEARQGGYPEPAFEDSSFFTATFLPVSREGIPEVGGQVPHKYPTSTPQVLQLLGALEGEMNRSTLQENLGLKDRYHFREAYLLPALQDGLIEMTIPEKPRSSRQKYRITEKGRAVLRPSPRR